MGRMIFAAPPCTGPSPYEPLRAYTAVDVRSLGDSASGCVFASAPMHLSAPPIVDPADAACAWLCRPGEEREERATRHARTFRMSDIEVRDRFWTKEAIRAFILLRVEGDVVAQRLEGGWLMHFASEAARRDFASWFSAQTLGRPVEVVLEESKAPDVLAWLAESGAEHRCHQCMTLYGWRLSLVFQHERDRVMFMLRWSGADARPHEPG